MSERVSLEDLSWAAGWLLAYEGMQGVPVAGQQPEDDDEFQARARRVAAWLDAEVSRRIEDAGVRKVAKRTGVSMTRARAALRRSLAAQDAADAADTDPQSSAAAGAAGEG